MHSCKTRVLAKALHVKITHVSGINSDIHFHSTAGKYGKTRLKLIIHAHKKTTTNTSREKPENPRSRGQVVFVPVTKLFEEEAHKLTVAVRTHCSLKTPRKL